MKLGKCLKAYRNKYEIDIYTLAKELGISTATLSRIENGTSPDVFTFNKILNWLINKDSK